MYRDLLILAPRLYASNVVRSLLARGPVTAAASALGASITMMRVPLSAESATSQEEAGSLYTG